LLRLAVVSGLQDWVKFTYFLTTHCPMLILPPPAMLCNQSRLCVSQQDHCKHNQSISLKLDVVTGPISLKNWLTSGGNPVLWVAWEIMHALSSQGYQDAVCQIPFNIQLI